jgi:hypothetical protein
MNKRRISFPYPTSICAPARKKVGIVTEEIKELIEGMKAATLDWEDSREHEVGVALLRSKLTDL